MKMLFEDVNKPEIKPVEITINTLEELLTFIDDECCGYVAMRLVLTLDFALELMLMKIEMLK